MPPLLSAIEALGIDALRLCVEFRVAAPDHDVAAVRAQFGADPVAEKRTQSQYQTKSETSQPENEPATPAVAMANPRPIQP